MGIKESDIPVCQVDEDIYSIVGSFCIKDKTAAEKAFASLYEMMKYYAK